MNKSVNQSMILSQRGVAGGKKKSPAEQRYFNLRILVMSFSGFSVIHTHQCNRSYKVTHICTACTVSWNLDGFPPCLHSRNTGQRRFWREDISHSPLRLHRRVFFHKLPTYAAEPLGVHVASSITADKRTHSIMF